MKKKYSVVIPCHNIDFAFFKQCIESIINQSIGFDNIQLIIVVHNCSESYKEDISDFLKDYLNKYPSIEVYELDNDAKTPSSPRNFGFKKATGEYVGFIDGDDSYKLDLMERVSYYNDKYKADTIFFRREYELEQSNLLPKKEIVLWDQLREEILLTEDNLQTEKLLSGLCGFATNKFYRREFLEENNLIFDEEIPFAEDFCYILEILSKVKTVLLLPQLIGYHYFINSQSLVQGTEKKGSLLIEYAKGYKKLFDVGLKKGFYMNNIISRLCLVLSTFLVSSKLVNYEERVEIKNILQPYIELTTKMEVSKLNTMKMSEEYYSIPRDVILNPEKWKNYDTNDNLVYDDIYTNKIIDPINKTLHDILEDNADTEIGQKCGFADIITVSGYQNRVGLKTYYDYKALIDLTTRVGEVNIFLKNNVSNYIYTPANTGETKFIPCNDKHIEPYIREFEKIVKNHDTFLFMESSFKKSKFNDNATTNSLYGTILERYFSSSSLKTFDAKTSFCFPRELLFPDRAVDSTYERLFFALRDENVDQIYAPYAWDIYACFKFLEENFDSLCDSIEKGQLPNTTKISTDLRNKLTNIIKPLPERAKDLRKIFNDGFDKTLIKRIWPRMNRMVSTFEKTMRVYTKELENIAAGVEFVNGIYASAEAIIGLPTDVIGIYKLYKGQSFFEFREENDIIKTYSELEEGKIYEIIITNRSGLYRYKSGDIIKIVKIEENDVFFEYAYNDRNVISVRDENNYECLNNTIIYDTIYKIANNCDFEIGDYSYAFDENKNVVIILEPKNIKSHVDKLLSIDKRMLINEFDKEFLKYDEYRKERESKHINGIRIYIGEPETHLLYRDLQRKNEYYASYQIRPTRLLDTKEKYQYFMNFVIE